MLLSPCNIFFNEVWLSTTVENTCDLSTGIVVLDSTNLVHTPPKVSIPRIMG